MNTNQIKKLDPEACRIIDALGGTNATARICQVKPPTVTGWREDGIPDARLMYLQVVYPQICKSVNKQIAA